MSKVLVLGSNSFSGASFSAHLLKAGHQVFGASRSPELNDVFLPYKWGKDAKNFRFEQIDLNHDLDKLEALMRRERLSTVVNFAAQSMVGQSWQNPDHWMTTNVVSLVRLQERLRHMDFLEKYVHVTTPEVYGSTSGWIAEDHPFNPTTPYAVSRAAGDMSMKSYLGAYNFPVLFTRAANVYGPGQQLYRIIPRTILFIRLGRKLELHGGGHSERSFIHIDDVSAATQKIMTGGKIGETYHISTNRIISVRALVEMVCAKMKVSFDDHVTIVGDRLGKDAAYFLDSKKIRAQLDWQDRISLEQGLDQTLDWVDGSLAVLKRQAFDYVHKA